MLHAIKRKPVFTLSIYHYSLEVYFYVNGYVNGKGVIVLARDLTKPHKFHKPL